MCMYAHYDTSKKRKQVISPEEKARRKRDISIKNMVQYFSEKVPSKYEKWEQSHFTKIMFFEKQGNKQYTGYCECGAVVPLTSARAARMIKCPVCKSEVRLTKNKSSSLFQENYFALLDRLDDGWIQRLFVTTKHTWMQDGAINVRIGRDEEERSFCDGKSVWFFHPRFGGDGRKWTEGHARQHGMGGWYAWRVCDKFLHTYPYNLSDIFIGSKYQYCALEIAARMHQVNPFYYLKAYESKPKLELLYKFGLSQLAYDIYCDRYETKRIMDKIKSLKDLGIDSKDEIKECRNLDAQTLIARKEVKKWNIEPDKYNFALAFIKTLNSRSGTDFQYSFITRERWFKYALTQDADYNLIASFLNDYIDYITDCVTLGLDLKNTAVKMPKSLRVSHKWAHDEIKIQETQVYDALIESAYENMHKLVEWSDGNLKIIMPKTSAEIVNEGVKQSHCVGRYCERVATGESIVLFLRRAADLEQNFYTMEIKKDMRVLDVVQCRGFENCEKTEEVEKFLQKYERWFNHRSLGSYNADNVMVKYFKAVHKKNGKYISNYDNKTEFKIGEWSEAETDKDSDKVAVKGLHVASMEFAQNWGAKWNDVAILEVETNIHDVIIPDAKDQVRTSKFKVLREVPFEEMGEWGAKRISKSKVAA